MIDRHRSFRRTCFILTQGKVKSGDGLYGALRMSRNENQGETALFRALINYYSGPPCLFILIYFLLNCLRLLNVYIYLFIPFSFHFQFCQLPFLLLLIFSLSTRDLSSQPFAGPLVLPNFLTATVPVA